MGLKEEKQGGREEAFKKKNKINFNHLMIRRKTKHTKAPTQSKKSLKGIKSKTKGTC